MDEHGSGEEFSVQSSESTEEEREINHKKHKRLKRGGGNTRGFHG